MRTKSLVPWLGMTLVLCAIHVASDVWAQEGGGGGRAGEAQDAERIRAIIAKLDSGARSELRAGFEAMGEMGPDAAAATPTANRVLARGLPVDLATTALRALGSVRHASSSKPIRIYLRHRHVAVRREAAKALIQTRGPQAKEGLRHALSDADAMVRGMAATGLGELRATEHIGALMSALDHQVPEAAAAIGQICTPEACEKFASRTGSVAFDVMTSGFDQILFRDPDQMPDDQKIRIIGRVRELGTQDANRFLQDVQARWPQDWSERVKKALDLAVRSTQGSPGGAS